MDTFNQSDKCGLWVELEDAILNHDTLRNDRVSVIAGPLLAEDDPSYRDGYVQLPRAYFKVVIYVPNGRFSTRSFILDQNLDGLRPAFPLDEFRIRPVSLTSIAERASLRFDPILVQADGAAQNRAVVADEPEFIDDATQVRW